MISLVLAITTIIIYAFVFEKNVEDALNLYLNALSVQVMFIKFYEWFRSCTEQFESLTAKWSGVVGVYNLHLICNSFGTTPVGRQALKSPYRKRYYGHIEYSSAILLTRSEGSRWVPSIPVHRRRLVTSCLKFL